MNLLNQPLAVLVSIAVAVGLWFSYFKIEPWTKRSKSFFFSNYFSLMFHVVMLCLAFNLILSTAWKNDLWYNLFLTRVNDQPTSAHVLSYLTIPIFYGLAFWKWRDSWRSFLITATMVYLHEGIWFIFYYMKYPVTVLADASFLILIASFGFIYWKKYGFKGKRFLTLWVILSQFVYDLVWFLDGFRITVTSTPFSPTIWTNDLLVNSIEVCGWLLLLATMIVWLHLNIANRETLAKEDKRE